jgi:hypothetical protein
VSWYYNSNSGAVQEAPDAVAFLSLHAGVGYHGPFPTKQAALDYYTNNKAANPGWKAPTGLAGNIANAVSSSAGKVKDAIGDPLGKFNLAGWFIRVGEILLGLILVGVGVAKLTGTSNVVSQLVKAKI